MYLSPMIGIFCRRMYQHHSPKLSAHFGSPTCIISLRTLGISEKKKMAKTPATPPKAPNVMPLKLSQSMHSMIQIFLGCSVCLGFVLPPCIPGSWVGTYSLVALLMVIPPMFGWMVYL
jgi:hypothetical protein